MATIDDTPTPGLCRPTAARRNHAGLGRRALAASALLLPTIVLLGLFIAYPFVKGVLLAVTDTQSRGRRQFVGIANFQKLWNDSIFHIASKHVPLHVCHTIFKIGCWGCGSRCC